MFRGACTRHQRDLENGEVEEGLTQKNNEIRSCDYSKAKQSGSISEILRGYPVWGETMWWQFVTADTTRTEGSVRVTAVPYYKGRDCVNWHLWNQLTQRCPYCRSRVSLEPIELALIYRGARTLEFFAGRGFTRVKGTDQRHNCPQYKLSCLHYRGQHCKKFGGGEGP